MNFSVIMVLRDEKGQCLDCQVERTFRDSHAANEFAKMLNNMYGTGCLNWVIDQY